MIPISIDKEWPKVKSKPNSIDDFMYDHPYRWWNDVIDLSPLHDYLTLDIPILVGIGENDERVPVESARFLESRFKSSGKVNLVVNIYPEANHQLESDSQSYRKAFFQALSDYVR